MKLVRPIPYKAGHVTIEAGSTCSSNDGKNSVNSSNASSLVLTSADVLLGRGRGSYSWTGNKIYQELLTRYVPAYTMAKRNKDKMHITDEIVATVKSRGGRFLGMCQSKTVSASKSHLYEISDAEARITVSQAMRHRLRAALKKKKRSLQALTETLPAPAPSSLTGPKGAKTFVPTSHGSEPCANTLKKYVSDTRLRNTTTFNDGVANLSQQHEPRPVSPVASTSTPSGGRFDSGRLDYLLQDPTFREILEDFMTEEPTDQSYGTTDMIPFSQSSQLKDSTSSVVHCVHGSRRRSLLSLSSKSFMRSKTMASEGIAALAETIRSQNSTSDCCKTTMKNQDENDLLLAALDLQEQDLSRWSSSILLLGGSEARLEDNLNTTHDDGALDWRCICYKDT